MNLFEMFASARLSYLAYRNSVKYYYRVLLIGIHPTNSSASLNFAQITAKKATSFATESLVAISHGAGFVLAYVEDTLLIQLAIRVYIKRNNLCL